MSIIRHCFPTAHERGLRTPHPNFLVVYQTDGHPRTATNFQRLEEDLHSEFGQGCAYDVVHTGCVKHLIVQDDDLALHNVCRNLARIKKSGWVDVDDWDVFLDEIRDLHWDSLGPAERMRLVADYGCSPGLVLEELAPTEPEELIVHLDREADGYD